MATIIHKQGKRYDTEKEKIKANQASKLRYSTKKWECKSCSITILLGNKWKHLKSKRHNVHLP